MVLMRTTIFSLLIIGCASQPVKEIKVFPDVAVYAIDVYRFMYIGKEYPVSIWTSKSTESIHVSIKTIGLNEKNQVRELDLPVVNPTGLTYIMTPVYLILTKKIDYEITVEAKNRWNSSAKTIIVRGISKINTFDNRLLSARN